MPACGLMQASDKLDTKTLSSAILVLSQADRSDLFTIKKKAQCNSAEQPINHQAQPTVDNQATVHTKADLMNLCPECFTGLVKFLDEPYHIQVEPSVPPKKTLCRLMKIHQQASFQQQLSEMQAACILKPVDHATPYTNSFVTVNKNSLTNMVGHSCTYGWTHPT